MCVCVCEEVISEPRVNEIISDFVRFLDLLFSGRVQYGLETGQRGMETDCRIDYHIPQLRRHTFGH